MNRRELIARSAIACGLGLAAGMAACGRRRSELTLSLTQVRRRPLTPDFAGLGYETSAVAGGAQLSASNAPLVRLIQQLGPSGVIRIGGIVSDFSRYEPSGSAIAEPRNTVFTRHDLDALGGLLEATGWQLMWSVNFAQGTIDDAIRVTRDLTQILGTHLLAIELGNEVDEYGSGAPPFRRAPYRYEDYRAEYVQWRAAINDAVPGVRFASPDVASKIDWVERSAAEFASELHLLPAHYYRTHESHGSREMLLQRDPRLMSILHRLGTASMKSGRPWRMCEANSFSGGGLEGVSNSFIGALWVLDFMLLLASRGASGVNIQTGINQLGFLSWYSPIRSDASGTRAGVPYFGMLAFAVAREGCNEVGAIDLGPDWTGVTAYLLGADDEIRAVVLINRSEADFDIRFGDADLSGYGISRLTAPSPESVSDVTFDGSVEPLRGGTVSLPKMSAAVVHARLSRTSQSENARSK